MQQRKEEAWTLGFKPGSPTFGRWEGVGPSPSDLPCPLILHPSPWPTTPPTHTPVPPQLNRAPPSDSHTVPPSPHSDIPSLSWILGPSGSSNSTALGEPERLH